MPVSYKTEGRLMLEKKNIDRVFQENLKDLEIVPIAYLREHAIDLN